MIRSVRADREGFKDVTFEPGFNVVLAERTEEATEKDSRNGSGKSSLIEVIHFCLGSGTEQNPLMADALEGWTFYLDLTIRGREISVSRNTARQGRIELSGDFSGWPIDIKRDVDTGKLYVSVESWRQVLAWLMFDLPLEMAEESYKPTARMLLPYFARRGRDAFSEPFKHFANQPSWSRQVHTAFLLGIDWRFTRSAELLRRREDALKDARKAIEAWRKTADVDGPDGTDTASLEGRLEALKINLERRMREGADQLASFQVHPQYATLELEATEMTATIHARSNENVADRQLLQFYEQSIEEERPADPEALAAMYAEAGVYFSDQLSRRLEDVREFHDRIYTNRRAYLEGEMKRLSEAITQREGEIEALSTKRASTLGVLRHHGALEEYLALQERHNELAEQLARVAAEIDQLRGFEEELTRVRLEKDQLVLDAREDFRERRPIWARAVDIFGANTAELYEHPGELALNVSTAGGLTSSIAIERGASQGVQEMMVLCYDLMVAELFSDRDPSPGFLVHDSTIFDGVDERQVARALQLAARKADDCGFQYVCCLNSDAVPWAELGDDFDVHEYVRLELSDAGEAGGLFGIRF